MTLSPDGLRKAAILVASLDTAAADALLDQFAPCDAQQVRQRIVDLGDVDPAEQRRVIDEFFRGEPPPAVAPPLKEAAGPVPAGARPFQFLQATEAEKLLRLLAAERPQTIALVLAHLPPERAAAVVSRLRPDLQAEVLRRLVDLEETDAEILREVEESLAARLASQVPLERRRVAGIDAVADILQATDPQTGGRIFDSLAESENRLAERLGGKTVAFDDLVEFDDQLLAEVFDMAGRELMVPALFGATETLTARMLAHLPAVTAERIRRELRSPGPLRLSDVEEARRRVARLARSVAYRAELTLGRSKPDAQARAANSPLACASGLDNAGLDAAYR